MNIIYLHGLSSSGQSNTANRLRELLTDDNVVAPDIPVSPIEALQLLLSLAGKYPADDTIVIGTSMGAMYASQMKGYRRILVNPAFRVAELLEENKGKRLPFFSKRTDGEEFFEVTETLCHEFKEMEANLPYVNEVNSAMVIGLFGDNDKVCDCQAEYCERYIYRATFQGGHRLTEDVIKNTLLPVIDWMKCRDHNLSRIYLPFEEINSGDTGFFGETDHCGNIFKIYKKGIGRKWFEEIVREYQGTKHYDGNVIDLHFPVLPEGEDERTVQLVYGNRLCEAPTVEVYGEDGVRVTAGDFIINGTIHVHRG